MPSAEALVIDASALLEALLGTELGWAVRARLRGGDLHAPAHLDAEVLSALGRLHRILATLPRTRTSDDARRTYGRAYAASDTSGTCEIKLAA